MSKHTLRIIDLFCVAANWQNAMDANQKSLIECKGNHTWEREIFDELKVWSAKRDKTIGKIRALVEKLDDREKHHLSGSNIKLEEWRAFGIEPTWMPDMDDFLS